MLNFLKKLFLENFIIKLFSLIFAFVLWFNIAARGTVEVNFVVPLEMRDIPDNLMVVAQMPGYVDVRLQGQEGMVKRLSVRDMAVFINLANARAGESVYNLSASNVVVPGSIRVAGISPSEVRIRLERVAKRDVAVVPELTGTPAPGYRVEKVEVFPKSIQAQGPESSLNRVRGPILVKVGVEGATGSFDQMAKVVPPAEYGVKLDENSVRVTVTLYKTKKQAR